MVEATLGQGGSTSQVSVLFGVSTGLSASLRGSMSFVGPRPLRFLDDLFIDPVPTDCAPWEWGVPGNWQRGCGC